jgi:hypothetical protein
MDACGITTVVCCRPEGAEEADEAEEEEEDAYEPVEKRESRSHPTCFSAEVCVKVRTSNYKTQIAS